MRNTLDRNGVLIAMSGGVDSSVAAHLMKIAGYECYGTTMRLYRNESIGLSGINTCCSEADIDDAADCAFRLDIPYDVVDYTADFRQKIIEKFISTYETGGTPNPCIDCNRYMKFDKLLEHAKELGLYYICTGHYARIEKSRERYLLKKAVDSAKDQTYVLYLLTQEQLSHTIFPLGELTKAEVRAIAESQGFVNAKKHDSQDICFVPDGDYAAFMERYTGNVYPQGDFILPDGNIVGKHKGAVRYTIGQRRGLGISYQEPLYVYQKDMESGNVFVGTEKHLYSKGLIANDANWIAFDKPAGRIPVTAKTRYRQREFPAVLDPIGGQSFKLIFDEPQRSVTKGQAVVLYQGDIVLGGGTIDCAINEV